MILKTTTDEGHTYFMEVREVGFPNRTKVPDGLISGVDAEGVDFKLAETREFDTITLLSDDGVPLRFVK
jgi:hypothetical protein